MKRTTPWLWPLLVAVLVLGITGGLWNRERQADARNLRSNFDFALRQTATRVEERIAAYEQMLRGTRGLFEASDEVSEQDFARYVEALLAGADFAGLRTIAYAPLLGADRVAAHEAARRAAGAADYRVRPAGPRDSFAPITYVAPANATTRGELGDDPLADPERRAAMLQARDSGSTAITRRLRPEGAADPAADAAVQMFMPLYANGRPRDDLASRRAALVGWVFASFRVADLMSSLYGEGTPGLEVRVHDGVELVPATQMYSNAGAAQGGRPARFEAQEYIGFAGHTWTLSVRSSPEFEQRFSSDSARIIGVAGSGLALLLALITWLLATGRERAHAAAHAMTQELRASTERYQRIVETADEGIWTVDAEARITFINPKMEQMLGWRADEVIGRRWIEFVPEDDRSAMGARAVDRVASDLPQDATEVRLQRKDGSDLWVTLTTSPVRDAEGRAEGTLAMVTDITERRQAAAKRTLLEAQLRQSQKMEAIGTLAGGIAHDFNNILAAILGNVALVQRELGAGHAATGRLEQIGQAATRARSLVQQIVAFSRRQPQELVAQPLAPLLEETLKLLRSTLPAQVELESRIVDPSLAIDADATQLQQVLMNLCTNAWHAMHGSPGRIVLGLDGVALDGEAAARLGDLGPGRYAHLWVSDNGCGMDEATRARVFEPFFTTKPVGQGTGLGLSVVHGIVTSHRGAIAVMSRPGLGSSFDMYFPLAQPLAPQLRQRAEPSDAPRGQGQHVLYVDDDPVMVLMVEGLLQASGYRVTCADDAQGALRRLGAPDADFVVVVTDFNMPDLSGIDLARELARVRPGLPVVITSGYVSEELRHEARQAGVRHVLQKEFTLEQLPALVHRVLATR